MWRAGAETAPRIGSPLSPPARVSGTNASRTFYGSVPPLHATASRPLGATCVCRSRKAELFISLKTAKKLGVTISQSVPLRADEVIE